MTIRLTARPETTFEQAIFPGIRRNHQKVLPTTDAIATLPVAAKPAALVTPTPANAVTKLLCPETSVKHAYSWLRP